MTFLGFSRQRFEPDSLSYGFSTATSRFPSVSKQVHHLPKQTVRSGEMGNWCPRRGGVEDVGDGVEGLDEPFLFRDAESDGVPAVHLAGLEQCAANGGLRNESLHPGGEDFGDPRVLLGIEDILHSPQIQGVVPVEDGPDEATQVLVTGPAKLFQGM